MNSSACWIWQAGDGNVTDPLLKKNIEQMAAKGENKPFNEYDQATYELERNKDSGYGFTFRGYKVYDKDGKETSAGDRSPGWAQLGDTTVANRAFFDEGELAVRQLMDIGAHGGGYGRQAGESSHYYTTVASFYYFLTGLEFIKDSIKVSHDEYAIRSARQVGWITTVSELSNVVEVK